MDNLTNSSRGPPGETINAVLTNLLGFFTDQQGRMPLPLELLQFVGMHNPELAEALYQLKFGAGSHPQGPTGEALAEFVQHWTPETVEATMTSWGPAGAVPFTLPTGLRTGGAPANPANATPAAQTPTQPQLNYDWATIAGSLAGRIPVARDMLANGQHEEWNKVGVAFQMVAGHLDHGHVEPAGAGFINVMDYIIFKVYRLGVLPDAAYVHGDPRTGTPVTYMPVALRDKRNFWAQFYYFARYVLTEQLLRAKAVEAVLLLRETAGTPARNPHYLPNMGPDHWWVFGRKHDQAWETYFQHIFSNKTLPAYLRPWFSQEDGTAPAQDEEEKENTAPEEAFPDLMSYATVTRIRQCLEAIGERLYTGDDKPSQGASDNLLPEMFYDDLLDLAEQCTINHPWTVAQIPVVRVGLQRVHKDDRGRHMDPLDYYDATH